MDRLQLLSHTEIGRTRQAEPYAPTTAVGSRRLVRRESVQPITALQITTRMARNAATKGPYRERPGPREPRPPTPEIADAVAQASPQPKGALSPALPGQEPGQTVLLGVAEIPVPRKVGVAPATPTAPTTA